MHEDYSETRDLSMIRIQDRLVCAWISLMVEKHQFKKNFELKNVLFSVSELLDRSKALFPNDTEASGTDVRKAAMGSSYTEYPKYFISEPYDSLNLYYMLAGPTVYLDDEITPYLISLIEVLLAQNTWIDKPSYATSSFVAEILKGYFEKNKNNKFVPQQELSSISTQEATWIAAATLAYNEYYRTGSKSQEDYAFYPKTIKELARTYNTRNSEYSLSQRASQNCVHGKNNQGYSYLIELGGARRVSFFDEAAKTKPDNLHESFRVKTILGEKSVDDILRFIKEVYSVTISRSIETGETYSEEENRAIDIKTFDSSAFTEQDFLDEIYMSAEDFRKLKTALEYHKNIILRGAPGVGKSYAAKFLAYTVMHKQGAEADERIMTVQFHQSYSYEDFIEGLRPAVDGTFRPEQGIFAKFCEKAAKDTDNLYFFIIDEINRGNLSRIFGELFALIEDSKRERVYIPLLYSKKLFTVPKNLYIIGMMNTADRSLAMLDYALRRRFAFVTMKPGFYTEQFEAYQREVNSSAFNRVIATIKELNREISDDSALGPSFQIGHSYFCGYNELSEVEERQKKLLSTIEYSIIPMLEEYWFEDTEKAERWGERLMNVAQAQGTI